MKTKLFMLICSVGLLTLAIYIYVESGKNQTLPEDIEVNASLQPNSNERMSHKQYMLDVTIHKKKTSKHMIYPYHPQLYNMSYDSKEEEGYFVADGIGSDGIDMSKVAAQLEKSGLIKEELDPEGTFPFIGFYSPEEAGEHKMRMYFEVAEQKTTGEMYLVYVHKEKGWFGQDIGWTKLIRVNSNR